MPSLNLFVCCLNSRLVALSVGHLLVTTVTLIQKYPPVFKLVLLIESAL